MMKKEITLGKKEDCHLVLAGEKISGLHAKVTLQESEELVVEDVDTTNGTFVNKRRIKSRLLSEEDQLFLADKEIDVLFLRELFTQEQDLPKGGDYEKLFAQEQIFRDFEALEEVYLQYKKDRKGIMRGSGLKKTGIRAGLMLIPIVGRSLGTLATGAINTQDKIYELDEQFKIDYVCPKCKTYLGNVPYEGLVQKKSCKACKTQWVRDTNEQ